MFWLKSLKDRIFYVTIKITDRERTDIWFNFLFDTFTKPQDLISLISVYIWTCEPRLFHINETAYVTAT